MFSQWRHMFVWCASAALVCGSAAAGAQTVVPQGAPPAAMAGASPVAVTPPPDYVIGPEDQLSVVFFHDKDMSADVTVRPDGRISLPLLNEIEASGLTPEQLRQRVSEQAKKFIQDPNATILVRQINSRKVFITGSVEKPGNYPLLAPTTVLQLIATAGGLKEYADSKKIVVVRTEGGRQVTYRFNYKDVVELNDMKQNIALKPGDTIVVP